MFKTRQRALDRQLSIENDGKKNLIILGLLAA